MPRRGRRNLNRSLGNALVSISGNVDNSFHGSRSSTTLFSLRSRMKMVPYVNVFRAGECWTLLRQQSNRLFVIKQTVRIANDVIQRMIFGPSSEMIWRSGMDWGVFVNGFFCNFLVVGLDDESSDVGV
ncbi:hypothetical protein Tco_0006928 [Tanacetum coccineum]